MSAVPQCAVLSDADYRKAAARLFKPQKIEGYESVALHLYRTADGANVYGRVRMHRTGEDGAREKLVRPFHHDGTKWTKGEPQQEEGGKLLYGLPELAATPHALIVVCEGEQKADLIMKTGASRLVGVTSGSATSANGADWSPLSGRAVLLWPDNDPAGTKYADEVSAKLEALGCTVQRLDAAALGLPEAGDVVDWVAMFETAHGRVPDADDVLALPRIDPCAEPVGDTATDAQLDDDSTVAMLAALSPMQYDRVRKSEAKRLKVQLATLDMLVKSKREQTREEDGPFPEVVPWPELVDLAALLKELALTVRRFIVCDDETIAAVALWIVAAWFVDDLNICPVLLINAPEKACGKTILLTLIGKLVPRPAQLSGISPSVLFRTIEKYQPTLLIDEIETVLTKEAEDLRGLLNAGHTRDSAYVWRSVVVGDDFEPKRFNVFGFKAIAGINADRLAETITSRSIIAALRRRLSHEKVERLRHAEPGLFETLSAKLARWRDDNSCALRDARPALPDELSDRDQDNWEPLLAIADLAGGRWPGCARRVACHLCGNGESSQSTGAELLADIRAIFEAHPEHADSLGQQRIWSVDLLGYLCDDEERPWATWNRGKPLNASQLAKLLKPYGIASRDIKARGNENRKGYRLEQFREAFQRYLSQHPPLFAATALLSNPSKGFEAADTKNTLATLSYSLPDGNATAGSEVEAGSTQKNRDATAKPLSDKEGSEVDPKKGGLGKSKNPDGEDLL
jgi:putative DNA primase/helicase